MVMNVQMADLEKYKDFLDEDLLKVWAKCAEYLIKKYKSNPLQLTHKHIENKTLSKENININLQNFNISKIPYSSQQHDITEYAGIAMGLLFSLYCRPWKLFRVLKRGKGYDYYYIPINKECWENIEMTASQVPNEANKRLQAKIQKFSKKFPDTSGYISVSCFPDKTQYFWGVTL